MGYCVYKHTSPSKKVYVGITSLNPLIRWQNGGGYRSNNYFTKAILKYGWDNFKHEILFENLTKEEAEQKEIELIKLYKSNDKNFGYNIAKGGNSVGKHSEETKMKISASTTGVLNHNYGKKLSDEHRKKLLESHTNKKYTPEHRKKISEALKSPSNTWRGKHHTEEAIEKIRLNSIGKHHTEETKIKIGLASKSRKHSEETKKRISKLKEKPIKQLNDDGVVMIFNSAREAYKLTGVHFSKISAVCNGKRKHAGGFVWEFIENL